MLLALLHMHEWMIHSAILLSMCYGRWNLITVTRNQEGMPLDGDDYIYVLPSIDFCKYILQEIRHRNSSPKRIDPASQCKK